MASVDIWGFKVGLSTDGRKIWPKSIKREAVRRVRDEGCPVKLIADELCTRDTLVIEDGYLALIAGKSLSGLRVSPRAGTALGATWRIEGRHPPGGQ